MPFDRGAPQQFIETSVATNRVERSGALDGLKERHARRAILASGQCYVTSPVSADLLAQLQRGKTLHIRFQNLAKETVDGSMPLAGFATAYEGIK